MGWCMTPVYQNCSSCVWNRISTSSQRSWFSIFLQVINNLQPFFIITTIPGQLKSLVLQEIFCCLIVSLSLSLHSLVVPFLWLDYTFFWNKHCIFCLRSTSQEKHRVMISAGEVRVVLGSVKLGQAGSWTVTPLSVPGETLQTPL